MYRYADPLNATRSLDLIAVTPVALGVLEVIMNDEQIRFANKIKIAAPGQEV